MTPTELLADTIACPGAARRWRVLRQPAFPDDLTAADRSRGAPLRFLVCSGDLGHPRKKMKEAVVDLAGLADRRGPVVLTAIGRNPEPLLGFASRHAPQVRIEAVGPLEPARVRQLMQACDALLFPSRYEEWGYVAVESLLCGTPVVTYPVYPFGEMLSGGLGVVAEGLGPSNFAAAIERSLLLPRGRGLSDAANARFGCAAIGERLAPLWRSQGERGRQASPRLEERPLIGSPRQPRFRSPGGTGGSSQSSSEDAARLLTGCAYPWVTPQRWGWPRWFWGRS